MAGNLGMAMLFEHRVRTRGASSAATEMRKNIGVENRPERENRQGITNKKGADFSSAFYLVTQMPFPTIIKYTLITIICQDKLG